MPTTPQDKEALLAQLKSAPAPVKLVAGLGALLGGIVLLGFCASAFAGHTGWGRALASGLLQFFLLWVVSVSVQGRHRWAWWALLLLVLLRVWGGLGHTLRIIRVTVQGGLADHGREIVFDAVGAVQLALCCVLLCLLFSRTVREYVRQ